MNTDRVQHNSNVVKRSARLAPLFMVFILLISTRAAASPPSSDEALFASSAPPQPLWLAEVENRLRSPHLIRARFTQQRQVKGLTKPLISTGHFIVARDLGVAWMQESPFHITHVVTSAGMKQISFEGSSTTTLAAPASDATSHLSRLLLALFSGHFQELSAAFDLTAHGDAKKWRMEVVPTNDRVRSFLLRAAIQGEQSLNECTIEESSGDIVITTFGDQEYDSTPLTIEERALFQ